MHFIINRKALVTEIANRVLRVIVSKAKLEWLKT